MATHHSSPGPFNLLRRARFHCSSGHVDGGAGAGLRLTLEQVCGSDRIATAAISQTTGAPGGCHLIFNPIGGRTADIEYFDGDWAPAHIVLRLASGQQGVKSVYTKQKQGANGGSGTIGGI
jgi:hypothetical protein